MRPKWKSKKYGRKGNRHISLDRLIEVLQAAREDSNDSAIVEFWVKDKCFVLKKIGVFSVLPDVTITLRPE